MNYGICTNEPSRCARARSRQPSLMSGPDPRCPEPGCGRPLRAERAGTGPTAQRAQRSMAPVILLGIVAAAALAAGGVKYFRRPATPAPKPGPDVVLSERFLMRLSGSNTIGADLAPRLVERWLEVQGATAVAIEQRKDEHGKPIPERVVRGVLNGQSTAIEIRAHGSGFAFKDLSARTADVGMASRRIKPGEAQDLAAMGDMVSAAAEQVIGLDGVAIIVSPSNRLPALDRERAGKIFRGEITDWSELGQPPGLIEVLALDENSGTYDTFKTLVLGGKGVSPRARRYEDSSQLEADVVRSPRAIGFVGLPFIKSSRPVPVADGAAPPFLPTVLTIKKEAYALSRRLYFYVPPAIGHASAAQFVDFVQSDAGQAVVKAAGFVDLAIAVKPGPMLAAKGCQMSSKWPGPRDEYCRAVARSQDTETALRFSPGSSTLDSRASRDLQRILKVASERAAPTFVLIGFADGVGPYAGNIRLSRDRADTVATALRTLGLSDLEVMGFGQELPVADNGYPEGRERNRRVEVRLRE